MKINVKNIGRVAEADVEIDGIAVVAGENGTGKARSGKLSMRRSTVCPILKIKSIA